MTTETQLTGSEKQIAWATEIRTNLLAGFADLIAVTKNAAETARQTGSATEENIQKAIALVESRISHVTGPVRPLRVPSATYHRQHGHISGAVRNLTFASSRCDAIGPLTSINDT